MEKLCTGCNRALPVTSEYFHKRKDTRDGFCTRCKECISSYYAKYWKENHETVVERKREQNTEYRKRNKDVILERQRKEYAEHGYKKEYMDKYYIENRQRILNYRKNYVRTEEGRAKKKAHDQTRRAKGQHLASNYTLNDWKRCKAHFENCCAYCGKQATLTREHFIPLVSGGEYTINNIIPACKPCNSKKKQSDFFTWYPKQSFYSKQREQRILRYLNYNENKMQQLALL